MKILAIHNYYKVRSGEDIAFDATVEILRNRGHEVVCLTETNADIRANAHRAIGSAVLAQRAVLSARSFVRALTRALRERPDVALVQNVFPLLSPSVYLALRLARVPVVQRLFNYRLVCTNGVLYTQGQICERCVSGSALNAVRYRCYRDSRVQSAVLTTSLSLARWAGVWNWGVDRYVTPDRFLGTKVSAALADPTKLRVLFNPSPPIPAAALVERLRSREVLFVGRLVREKGIHTFLACARLLPDVSFVVVGGGGDELRLREESADLTNVDWRGPVYGDALLELLGTVGLLVLPSEWYDNMPLILTQALLAGTPIVASDIDGIPEFIIEGGTGRLAPPGDAAAFARRIRETLTDELDTKRMSREGRRRATEWFGEESFAASIEAVFADAVSAASAR